MHFHVSCENFDVSLNDPNDPSTFVQVEGFVDRNHAFDFTLQRQEAIAFSRDLARCLKNWPTGEPEDA